MAEIKSTYSYLYQQLDLIRASENEPIRILISEDGETSQWIYYKDSALLSRLRYYPIYQLVFISIFMFNYFYKIIIKNHIPIITFLKPGIIKVEKNKGEVSEFFVEDGTVEYFNDVLVILSSSAIDVKKLTKDFLNKINKDAEEKLATENISDHDRYILNHKINIIKEIRI